VLREKGGGKDYFWFIALLLIGICAGFAAAIFSQGNNGVTGRFFMAPKHGPCPAFAQAYIGSLEWYWDLSSLNSHDRRRAYWWGLILP